MTMNPFVQLPQGFDPSRYYGSRAWVEQTLENASANPPRSIELIGLPGMGKSTLLQYLADPNGALAQEHSALQHPFRNHPSSMLMVLVEFRLLPTETHPFIYLHDKFFNAYRDYRERSNAQFRKSLPDLIPSKQPGTPVSATTVIEEALTLLKEKGIRIIFLLDDFHLAFGKLTQAETSRLRPWREMVPFIISTERRLNEVNSEAAGSPFFQMLRIVPFGGLTLAEAKRLIRDPSARAGWAFNSDDINFTVEQAGTHPHLLIVAGAVLWEFRENLRIAKGKKISVSKEHPQIILGHFKERFAATFQMYQEHLAESEWRALTAALDGQLSAQDYSALAYLERLGLVEFAPEASTYTPFSPLFSEFLKEKTVSTSSENGAEFVGVEGNLFHYLSHNTDRVCSFDEISTSVWGEIPPDERGQDILQRRVQVAVSRLRKKLQQAQSGDIISVRGKGYRLLNN